jgi:hypothetical protein
VSARFSPDGLYYWDGQHWLSTISPDGRFRWNGSAWVPTGQSYVAPPTYQQTYRTQRVPTSWTRPLQFAVAGWYTLSAIYTLTLPFWMGGRMADIMNQSMQRQQQRYPSATPPPPEFVNAMSSIMTGAVWIGALVGFAICLVAIVGALNRWTWLFYAVMVLLGLGILGVPVNVINIARGSALSYGVALPSWINWEGLLHGTLGGALAIAMLYALVKRGPWGMTRQLPTAGQ